MTGGRAGAAPPPVEVEAVLSAVAASPVDAGCRPGVGWTRAGRSGRGGGGRVGPSPHAVAAVDVEEVDAVLSGVSASRRAEAPAGGEAGVRGVSAGRPAGAAEPGWAAKGVGTALGSAAPVGPVPAGVVDDVEAVLSGVSTSPRAGTPVGGRDDSVGRLALGGAAPVLVAAGTVVRRNGLPTPVEGTLDVGLGDGLVPAAGPSGRVT
jgi:hypothetical protein